MPRLEEFLAVLTEVWTTTSVLVAVFAGLVLGFVVLGYLSTLPTYATAASPGQVARVTAMAGAVAGLVFYAGQAAAAAVEGDATFDRLISRMCLWVLYSCAMALGLWLRLRLELHRRRRHVLEVAHAAVEEAVGPS